jgi:hypothetical protein
MRGTDERTGELFSYVDRSRRKTLTLSPRATNAPGGTLCSFPFPLGKITCRAIASGPELILAAP